MTDNNSKDSNTKQVIENGQKIERVNGTVILEGQPIMEFSQKMAKSIKPYDMKLMKSGNIPAKSIQTSPASSATTPAANPTADKEG